MKKIKKNKSSNFFKKLIDCFKLKIEHCFSQLFSMKAGKLFICLFFFAVLLGILNIILAISNIIEIISYINHTTYMLKINLNFIITVLLINGLFFVLVAGSFIYLELRKNKR